MLLWTCGSPFLQHWGSRRGIRVAASRAERWQLRPRRAPRLRARYLLDTGAASLSPVGMFQVARSSIPKAAPRNLEDLDSVQRVLLHRSVRGPGDPGKSCPPLVPWGSRLREGSLFPPGSAGSICFGTRRKVVSAARGHLGSAINPLGSSMPAIPCPAAEPEASPMPSREQQSETAVQTPLNLLQGKTTEDFVGTRDCDCNRRLFF